VRAEAAEQEPEGDRHVERDEGDAFRKAARQEPVRTEVAPDIPPPRHADRTEPGIFAGPAAAPWLLPCGRDEANLASAT
jgi:hypothetical protein